MNDGATAEFKTMYFVVGDRKSAVAGYAWRRGASGTSFYIKARYTPLSSVKISLHGPDPRPGLSLDPPMIMAA